MTRLNEVENNFEVPLIESMSTPIKLGQCTAFLNVKLYHNRAAIFVPHLHEDETGGKRMDYYIITHNSKTVTPYLLSLFKHNPSAFWAAVGALLSIDNCIFPSLMVQ